MNSPVNGFSARDTWRAAYRYLQELRMPYGFAASDAQTGVYATLFGRDSLWILMFLMKAVVAAHRPQFSQWVQEAGADILRALSRYQGAEINDAIDEQPGKIMHEYREVIDRRIQNMGLRFEGGRSYSGFDQTFLFISAYRGFSELFPGDPVTDQTWPHVERALSWIEHYADDDDDGLFEYQRRHVDNLLNQVWKDSFDSVSHGGASIPAHPIAWLDVQSYAFRSYRDAAHLYSLRGDMARSGHFWSRADSLQQQVNAQCWLEEEQCFAIALDGNKSPIGMVSSNAGHALWSGIVHPDRRDVQVRRLMASDMMTSYGLRTLSSRSSLYAPFAYHRGNVWPFDNGIFVMGLMENGYVEEARQVMTAVDRAIRRLGSPIELYVVLDMENFVEPNMGTGHALLLRRPEQENRNQGWTAAALLYFASVVAEMDRVELADS